MNIDKMIEEMNTRHEARMTEMEADHEAEMVKLREKRKAVEAEAAAIDAEIEAIDVEIATSKERTERSIKLFEAAQNRALQARTREEIEKAYADLRSVIEAF